MILLPPHIQRAWLRSFGAAVCLLGAVVVGMLAWLYRTEFLWLMPAVGVVFAAAMLTPQLLVWPYRAWNKLARLYACYAEALVLKISFFTVCVPAGWTGSRIQVKRPSSEGTLWLPRETQKPVDGLSPSHTSWVARYTAWAWQSGESWRMVLLPFLFLLSGLQTTEQESSVPENIYTLF